MTDAEASKTFFQVVVTESVLKLLAKGKEGQRAVAMVSKALGERLAGMDLTVFSPMLRLALEEVAVLAACLRALCGENISGDPLANLKNTPSLHVARNLLSQNGHWREQERRLKEQVVAMTTLLPELVEAEEKLARGKLDVPAQRLADRMVLWEEALPAGKQTPKYKAISSNPSCLAGHSASCLFAEPDTRKIFSGWVAWSVSLTGE